MDTNCSICFDLIESLNDLILFECCSIYTCHSCIQNYLLTIEVPNSTNNYIFECPGCKCGISMDFFYKYLNRKWLQSIYINYYSKYIFNIEMNLMKSADVISATSKYLEAKEIMSMYRNILSSTDPLYVIRRTIANECI